jgi:pilus assembly protein CpaF
MIHSFSRDEIICQEGNSCENAFIILSGKAEIIRKGESRIAGPGEIIGGRSLIRGEAYEDTVIARAPVTVDLLSLQDVENLINRMPVANAAESAAATDKDDLETHRGQAHTPSDMGPITSLIHDDSINDILINGCSNIYVERAGVLEKTGIAFANDAQVYALANSIVKDIGRKIDRNRPLVDARLLDGSRVNIIAPPLAVDGTSISIRKFSKRRITLDSMVENQNMNREVAEFLKVAGKCRLNIVISGGTGSGKTTLLNAISEHIDKEERVVTIEDAAELKLLQPHVVRLETRPHHIGMQADEEVSIRDLVRNALRMRPDRIIVGEVRGKEAFDMLQAMNSGHEGSLTTIHANHPRDALSRLENMISMTDLQIPMKSLRYQIASALHLIVQISRMRDGHRRITFVSEVVGMEGDMITMHDLFNFKIDGEDAAGKVIGKFKWSGIMPRFVRRIEYYGDIERLENALGVKFPKAVRLGKQA